MSDTIRAFIAITLPEHIISSIGKIQEGIKSYGFKVRWVRPHNIHLTIKFLGNVDEAEINTIGRTIVDALKEFPPISLAAKGIGVFPGIQRPRVLWVGVTGQVESLIEMQKGLDDRLEALGFPKENKSLKGHLTIGRVKGKIDFTRLGEAMNTYQGFASELFVADQVILFKSQLQSAGPVYTELLRMPLLH